MLRALLSLLFHRPSIRMGRVDNSRMRTTRIRNAQFVSFISSGGCIHHQHPDRHEQRLRRQRIFKTFFGALVGSGLIWFVVESAKAISIF